MNNDPENQRIHPWKGFLESRQIWLPGSLTSPTDQSWKHTTGLVDQHCLIPGRAAGNVKIPKKIPRCESLMERTATSQIPIKDLLKRLDKCYPNATTALRYSNPLELLVATILSAQCTDERVNKVTETLFKKYRSAADYARVSQEELEQDIKSTGFFRNKAKMIRECCQILCEKYGGEVPRDIDLLTQLPGIGRKTANVVLGTAYGIPTGVVVDTHVERVSRRLGLTREKNRDKIEQDLMRLIPKRKWIVFSHQLIHHGRQVCTARKPKCSSCCLEDLCPKVGVAK